MPQFNSELMNENAQKVLQGNSGYDRKCNDTLDVDRESIEFEMDLFEDPRGGREQVSLAQNGNLNIPTSHVTRRRSVKRKPLDTAESDTSEAHITETRFKDYDFNQEEFYKKQWQDAARILDRFLLVASFVIGSISAMGIFLQSPRIRELFIP